MSRRSLPVLLMVLLLVVSACGGSDEGDATTTTTTSAPPGTSSTTTEPEPGGMEAVRAAVIQIVGTGTFQDPLAGEQANVPGSGSGFIIDDEGHAVTNNHVVTGAAFLEVHLQGEDTPRNARVVGVSECSDLAVIDIDGSGFTSLDWYDGAITTGLPILAAGYPLGDPEYTLLEGIVAKERAGGETTWASVDAVIEHSADTLPGNSGGPILTEDGEVVAVNYAGNDLGQSFAIGRDVALPMVERLLEGDAESIGINGEAFFDGVFSGIWVYSVASGSPADAAGILPGDLITRLEGIELAVDGTMADYCDILRSHDAGDVLTVEVYRYATDEVLEGRLNGQPMEVVFSFAAELDDIVVPDDPVAGPAYTEYVNVTNDDGTIFVDVPVEWGDILGIPWEFDGSLVGPALTAAPSVDGFINTWGTPGVFIAASRQLPLTRIELLDTMDFSDSCTYLERVPYDDTYYVGDMDIWEACGPEGSNFLVITAAPPEQDYTVLVQILIAGDADWDAADTIIRSFTVVDPSGG